MGVDRSRLGAGETRLSPDLVAQRGFGTGFRGFDQHEVRGFLEQVADELRRMREHAAALERALRAAEEQAAHPKLDENTLMTALGEETAGILRSAKAAAADIKAKAEENAARFLREAHARADAIRGEAEGVLAKRTEEADRQVAGIREMAEAMAERARAEAAEAARQVLDQAKHEAKVVLDSAHATRDQMLGDLTRKRKVAVVQIEQLRAGRDRLLDAYRMVRRTLDEVTAELQRADAEARAAADEAGRRASRADVPAPAAVEEAGTGKWAAGTAFEPAEPLLPDAVAPAPGPPAAPLGPSVAATVTAGSVAAPPVAAPPEAEPAEPVATAAAATAAAAMPADGGPEANGRIVGGLPVVEAPSSVESVRVITPEEEAEPEGAPPAVSNEDERILQGRDEAITAIEADLARRLKRALQDEQNDLLDRLRSVKGIPIAAEVVPERSAHEQRFRDAGRPLLERAAAAGAEFAASLLPDPASATASKPDLDDLAGRLAGAIVDPLRRRLEQAFVGSDSDPVVLAESLGAAYREWKTQRIEQTAADQVAGAFARGEFSALPEGTPLRWIVDDVDGPCPDCDDNALAGSLVKGEPWPTGQPHPPAHVGCRCLVVPLAAATAS